MSEGQIGALDADPVCACQIYGPLRVKTVTIIEGAADTVKAHVNFDNFGHGETVVLTLSRTPAGWRIADIGNRTMKSVLAVLQASNARLTGQTTPKQK